MVSKLINYIQQDKELKRIIYSMIQDLTKFGATGSRFREEEDNTR